MSFFVYCSGAPRKKAIPVTRFNMDGEIEVHFVKPEQTLVPETKEGSVKLGGDPTGQKMGWVKIRQGHMALLPKGSAYQFRSPKPGVLLIQTIQGENTIERWADICQTT